MSSWPLSISHAFVAIAVPRLLKPVWFVKFVCIKASLFSQQQFCILLFVLAIAVCKLLKPLHNELWIEFNFLREDMFIKEFVLPLRLLFKVLKPAAMPVLILFIPALIVEFKLFTPLLIVFPTELKP